MQAALKSVVRETNIKVSVDTKAIDAVEVDSDTGLSNVTAARLVFYTADVLGNELVMVAIQVITLILSGIMMHRLSLSLLQALSTMNFKSTY